MAMELGEHDFPDVVLEVDHTTDVYRGKLRLYEAWGFPEVWVEVPNYRAVSRPKRRRAGLTIHVLEGGEYRESVESRAFPGWSAALSAGEGTGPDDDPMLRSLRGRSRAEGRAGMVRAMLSSRGIGCSEDFPADVPGLAESSEAVIVAVALACDSERDFRARIVRAHGHRAEQVRPWPMA